MPVLYTNPGIRGIGDALFLTAAAHEIKQRSRFAGVAVLNKNHSLFLNNPDVDVISCGYDDAVRGVRIVARESKRLPQLVGNRWSFNWLVLHSGLLGRRHNAHHGWPPKKRLLEEVAENCGLTLTDVDRSALRPYYWPYRHELQAKQDYLNAICIHSNAATYWTSNKQWPLGRIQRVVDALVDEHQVVQLGEQSDAPLQGVVDLRGKTTLRETAAILAQAKLLIGMEGGLMHLARAVDTRAVIVFTGFITPEYTGYDVNRNLFGATNRSDLPCWRREPCHCDCAERVTVNQVLEGVEWSLAQPALRRHFMD